MSQFIVSFAGAGRVAGALCGEMFRSGIKIHQIVSESGSDGRPLANVCNAEWSSELSFDTSNQVIIVAVPDHKLKEVLSSIICPAECVVAHTAGSYGLEVFPSTLRKTGVFYPLQTFSKGRSVSFNNLPFLTEASDDETGKILHDLARSIGGKVHFIDHEQRKVVHLAAVFVNNFTNYMLASGSEIAGRAGLSLEIFEPLIRETIAKALESGPEKSQTGPAIRNDHNTIEMHLELLSFSPELQKIYKELTDSIIKHYNKR
ncbi:MAG: DUF2520 domain-containing protein [Bacteroidales bacterium]|jgi:predicted short-subunit dehydrogenase-like oxidoreductase (DUF2520 family)|nr:DUF2520 domain-containing protein [Bacteroidales bacterium]